jgi:hypothetical protein
MAVISLRTNPQRRAVLTGESLPVRTILGNDGTEPVLAAVTSRPSPFRFELVRLEAEPQPPAYIVSNHALELALARGPLEDPEPGGEAPLEPGRRVSWDEDVAVLASEPFAPGDYQIYATYPTGDVAVRSLASAPITVRAPAITVAHTEMCRLRHSLVTVLAHREGNDTVLLERESFPRRHAYGIFHRRLTMHGGITQLATSIDTAPITGGRWTAWIDARGRLGAMNGWGTRTFHTPEPVQPGLEGTRLARPGFQLADASALFLVHGRDRDRYVMREAYISPDGWRFGRHWDWREPLPDRVAVRTGANGPVVYWFSAQPEPAVWWQPLGGEPAEAVRLADDGPLAAWEVRAIGDPGAIQLLCGPNADGRMAWRSVEASGGEPAPPLRFDSPAGAVREWAIPSWTSGAAPVVAVTDAGIVVAWPEIDGRRWQQLPDSDGQVSHLRLVTLDGRQFWLEWRDAGFGIRRRRLSLA